MDQDPKQVAIYLARARAVLGLSALIAPRLVGRLMLGRSATQGAAVALVRMVGARDLVLGIGALTSLNETRDGPNWLSMAAVADGADAVALLITPGVALRGRASSLVAAGFAVIQLQLARELADRNEAESPTIPEEITPAPLGTRIEPTIDDAETVAADDQ